MPGRPAVRPVRPRRPDAADLRTGSASTLALRLARAPANASLGGHFLWQSPRTARRLPTYRFGPRGYGMPGLRRAERVRRPAAVRPRLRPSTGSSPTPALEAARSPVSGDPAVRRGRPPAGGAADGRDDRRWPTTGSAADGIRIVAGDLVRLRQRRRWSATGRPRSPSTLVGELRETSGDADRGQARRRRRAVADRRHLRQPHPPQAAQRRSARTSCACGPSRSARSPPRSLGSRVPRGRCWPSSWRHLLENHPHDSLCGCSVDGPGPPGHAVPV